MVYIRWIAVLPFISTVLALAFSLVLLYAGAEPGMLESVAIIRLNMSMFGINIFGFLPKIPGLSHLPIRRNAEFDIPYASIGPEVTTDALLPYTTSAAAPPPSSATLTAFPTATLSATPSSDDSPMGSPSPTAGPEFEENLKFGFPNPLTVITNVAKTAASDVAGVGSKAASGVAGVGSKAASGVAGAATIGASDVAGEASKAASDAAGIASKVVAALPSASEILGQIKNLPDDLKGTLDDIVNEIEKLGGLLDFTKGLSRALGLSDWYSFHLLSDCRGKYTPFPLDPTAGYNVTHCSGPEIASSGLSYLLNNIPKIPHEPDQFNLSDVMDKELSIGPFHLGLNTFHLTGMIDTVLNLASNFFSITTWCYVIGTFLTAVSLLTSCLAFLMHRHGIISFINGGISAGATLFLLLGTVIATVISTAGHYVIQTAGKPFGITADAGTTFVTLSWAATLLSAGNLVYWIMEYYLGRAVGAAGKMIFGGRKERDSMDEKADLDSIAEEEEEEVREERRYYYGKT